MASNLTYKDAGVDIDSNLTYKDAGVDIDAGEELVERIKAPVKRTMRPEVIGGLGGFGALTRIPQGYKEPVLVSGTDGVGTKLRLAIDLERHSTVGQDLVAMCVNDLIVQILLRLLCYWQTQCGSCYLCSDWYCQGLRDGRLRLSGR